MTSMLATPPPGQDINRRFRNSLAGRSDSKDNFWFWTIAVLCLLFLAGLAGGILWGVAELITWGAH